MPVPNLPENTVYYQLYGTLGPGQSGFVQTVTINSAYYALRHKGDHGVFWYDPYQYLHLGTYTGYYNLNQLAIEMMGGATLGAWVQWSLLKYFSLATTAESFALLTGLPYDTITQTMTFRVINYDLVNSISFTGLDFWFTAPPVIPPPPCYQQTNTPAIFTNVPASSVPAGVTASITGGTVQSVSTSTSDLSTLQMASVQVTATTSVYTGPGAAGVGPPISYTLEQLAPAVPPLVTPSILETDTWTVPAGQSAINTFNVLPGVTSFQLLVQPGDATLGYTNESDTLAVICGVAGLAGAGKIRVPVGLTVDGGSPVSLISHSYGQIVGA